VIANDGEAAGRAAIDEALAAAQARGLDLVEWRRWPRPPVVKIMDYGKFKFEQAKAARAAKKKQHVIHLKEVKYRPGSTITISRSRRGTPGVSPGRQQGEGDDDVPRPTDGPYRAGAGVLDRVAEELKDISKVEQEAKLEGRNMSMVLAPK